MNAESISSCAYGIELTFDVLAGLVEEPDEEFEQIVRDVPTSILKKMLTEAVQTVRDYAIPVGDKVSEAALHVEINFMLGELKLRSTA